MPIPWHHEPFDYAHFAHRPSRNPQFGIRIDALTPDVIDSICLHIEATALAGDEARVMGDTYTPEEIEGYQTGHTEANRVLKAALVLGKQDVLRPPLEEFLRLYQYELNAPEDGMRRLTLAHGRALLRVNEKLLSRHSGNDERWTKPAARKAVRSQRAGRVEVVSTRARHWP